MARNALKVLKENVAENRTKPDGGHRTRLLRRFQVRTASGKTWRVLRRPSVGDLAVKAFGNGGAFPEAPHA